MNKLTHKQELQKVFDAVAVHLMTQKHKSSYTHEKGVFYFLIRPIDGARCGLGCLLPDDYKYEDIKYLNELCFPSDVIEQSWQQAEGRYQYKSHQQRSFIDEIYAKGFKLSWELDRFFLGQLQKVHDAHEVKDWYRELQQIAFVYGLDHTELNKAYKENDHDVTAFI